MKYALLSCSCNVQINFDIAKVSRAVQCRLAVQAIRVAVMITSRAAVGQGRPSIPNPHAVYTGDGLRGLVGSVPAVQLDAPLLAGVHHSIAILYHEVPNPNITIRNFFIAVCCCYGGAHGAGREMRAV